MHQQVHKEENIFNAKKRCMEDASNGIKEFSRLSDDQIEAKLTSDSNRQEI